MTGLTTAWSLAARRIFAYRGISIAVAVGILVASVVLAFIPAYERAMSDLGVAFVIDDRAGEDPLATVYAPAIALGNTLGAAESVAIDQTTSQAGWFLDYEETGFRSAFLRITPSPGGEPGRAVDGFLISSSGLDERVTVVEGALPSNDDTGLNAVIGVPVAEDLGLAIGDPLTVNLGITNCFPPPPGGGGFGGGPPPPPCTEAAAIEQPVTLTVAAIVETTNPRDPFWTAVLFRPDLVDRSDAGVFYPVAIPYHALRTSIADAVPSLAGTGTIIFDANPDQIDSATAPIARSRLDTLQQTLVARDLLLSSTLDDAINEYTRQSNLSVAPIRVLAFQAALVVVFYVLIVGSLLADQLLPETALLRGRGASVIHIAGLAIFQGLTFAIPGVLVAPFLAAGIVSLLGLTPALELARGAELLPFTLDPIAFVYAAAGAVIATVAAALPTILSTRVRPAEERRRLARTEQAPFFQRYYLDLGVLAIAAVLIVNLYQQDAVFDRNAFGGLTSDPLILMAPTIFGLATVVILLRILPLALKIGAALLRPASGAMGEMALTSLSRSSGRYARLVALLVLVFALGSFAATFAPTLDRSFRDRTAYDVGPPIRANSLGDIANRTPGEVVDLLESVDGVERAMGVWRGSGSAGLNTSLQSQFEILAVDPFTAPAMFEWRPDFADDRTASEVFGALVNPSNETGIPIPGEPESIAFDVYGEGRGNTNTWIRLRDANGRSHTVNFGKLGEEGWITKSAVFSESTTLGNSIAYPLTITSLYLTEPVGFFNLATDPILIDNLRVVDGGTTTTIDSFESEALRWSQFAVNIGVDDSIESVLDGNATDGSRVLAYAVQQGRSPSKRGIVPRAPIFPVAAIASSNFLSAQGVRIGDVIEVAIGSSTVQVVINDTVDFLPTLQPGGRGFLVLDANGLFAWGADLGEDPARPTEGWIIPVAGADPGTVSEALARLLDTAPLTVRDVEVGLAVSNPTLAAGASGLLWFGFVAAFLVLVLALVLSLALDAVQRKVQFSIVRAMGFSARSVYGVLAIEYTVIVLVGAIAGIVLGLQVSETMTSFLEFNEGGRRVLPPFVLRTNWDAVAVAAVSFAVFAAIGIAAAGTYLVRASIARAIRLSS